MGLTADCHAEWGTHRGRGRAQLETDALRFKGEFTLSIPLRDIRGVTARDGRLEVRFSRTAAVFDLGPQAERWREKILHPPSVLDKLGIKPGLRVSVVGRADEALVADVRARTPEVTVGRARAQSEVVLLFAAKTADLARLARLREAIVPAGAVWVLWPKGRPELKEDHVREAARGVDLVDVKVASVSATLSGLKLMIPRASR
jgi:hypothetical protein